MLFRFSLPIEVELPTDELSTSVAVNVQLVCQGGKWRAQCQEPPMATLMHDTMEEALAAAAKEIEQEWRAGTGVTPR